MEMNSWFFFLLLGSCTTSTRSTGRIWSHFSLCPSFRFVTFSCVDILKLNWYLTQVVMIIVECIWYAIHQELGVERKVVDQVFLTFSWPCLFSSFPSVAQFLPDLAWFRFRRESIGTDEVKRIEFFLERQIPSSRFTNAAWIRSGAWRKKERPNSIRKASKEECWSSQVSSSFECRVSRRCSFILTTTDSNVWFNDEVAFRKREPYFCEVFSKVLSVLI
jgi:hypothetical protein